MRRLTVEADKCCGVTRAVDRLNLDIAERAKDVGGKEVWRSKLTKREARGQSSEGEKRLRRLRKINVAR